MRNFRRRCIDPTNTPLAHHQCRTPLQPLYERLVLYLAGLVPLYPNLLLDVSQDKEIYGVKENREKIASHPVIVNWRWKGRVTDEINAGTCKSREEKPPR